MKSIAPKESKSIFIGGAYVKSCRGIGNLIWNCLVFFHQKETKQKDRGNNGGVQRVWNFYHTKRVHL